LEKWEVNILFFPLTRKSENHIYNSMDFIEQMSQVKTKKGADMMPLEVVSLFTSVPRNETMAELKLRLEGVTRLLDRITLPIEKNIDLINICLNATSNLARNSTSRRYKRNYKRESQETKWTKEKKQKLLIVLTIEFIYFVNYLNKIYSDFTLHSSKLCMNTHLNSL
jgi:hypothetical protein